MLICPSSVFTGRYTATGTAEQHFSDKQIPALFAQGHISIYAHTYLQLAAVKGVDVKTKTYT